MTADHIAFHATERPDAVALVDRGRAITFAAFSRDIRKFTGAVAELEMSRGASVAVGCDDVYTHWLLLLAFERLGIATASFEAGEGDGATPLLASVDLVFSEPHFPTAGARRHRTITSEWVARTIARDAEDKELLPARTPNDRARILRTSGTTGSAKRISNSRSAYDAKIMRWIVPIGLGRRSRLLVTMSLAVQGMYSCASACLRAGGTVIAARMPEPWDIALAILEHGITMLILAPIQIKRVLDALPDGFARPPSLTLCSFGAAVSPALRERALSALATEIIDMYGTNETGFISSIDSGHDNGISTIWPGIRVEIVDDHDAPLPHGQIGRIRAQTPEMVQDYLDDPETSQRMFKDGWFYPGDIGILHGARGLQILGRGDDLLNFGGRKIPPEALEQAILQAVPLRDVGVCSAPSAEGIAELLIGLVDPQGDDRELLERLSDALKPFPVGKFGAARLPEIPRNANGKIRRDLLRSGVMDVLRSSRIVRL